MQAQEIGNAFSLTDQAGLELDQEYNGKGFCMGKAAKIALHTLTVTAACCTAAPALIACVTGAAWTIPVMIVSAVALSILFLIEIAIAIKPYLHEKLVEVADRVRAFTVDIFAKLLCGLLYAVPQTLFDPKKEDCSPDHTPTLFVHGYLHNSSAWGYFRYRFGLAGKKNLFTIDLGNPFLSIEEFAERVRKKIMEIKELTGRNDIHLVGHSMGGIVSSYFATELAKEAKVDVRSVITLGSPLNGTRLRGIGKAADQMYYQSEFIQKLRDKILKSALSFYHVGSETDDIILPCHSTVMKENKFTLFKNLGHASYLFSDRVIRHCLSYYKEHIPKEEPV